ncbi:MAG: hypothetical protein ACRDZY_05750 [Acidimicrobiales bacterium]
MTDPDLTDSDTGPGSREGPGAEPPEDEYEATTVRALVLTYPGPRYVWVVGQLADLIEARGLETNSDALVALLETAAGEDAPPLDPASGDG